MNDLSKLPNDPRGFFELPAKYDRRDLKRAYGKAIRIYKPETHPTEFGRVRDAYERLEKSLRYGKQQQQLADATATWKSDNSKAPKRTEPSTQRAHAGSDPGHATQSNAALSLKQLAILDPHAALQQVTRQPRRSPPDYYLAAVLSDATAGRPTTSYLGHLLNGLAAYPADPGLINLASEYLRAEVPDSMLAKMVRIVADKIRAPLFYMLTEPLWLRLLDALKFDQFERLLDHCERKIQQTEPEVRTTFFLRLLRSAIWTAPPHWIKRVMQELECQSAQLDDTTAAELEYLSQVQQLLTTESTIATTDPTRQKLLTALRLVNRKEDAVSTATVLRMLTEIARDARSVQRAFPMNSSQRDATWVFLIDAIAEHLQFFLDAPNPLPSARVESQLRALAGDLIPHLEPIKAAIRRVGWSYRYWALAAWVTIGTALGVAFALVVSLSAQSLFGNLRELWAVGGMFAFVATSIASFCFWIYPKYLRDRELHKQQISATNTYTNRWRSRLFRYAGSAGETIDVQLAQIDAMGRSIRQNDLGDSVAFFVQQDVGLRVYSALQSLLR